MRPPLRATCGKDCTTAVLPVASITTSKAPNSSTIAAIDPGTSCRFITKVPMGDNDDASDSLNSLGSANTTLDAPATCRNCVSSTPVGPAPKTTTEHPAMGSSRSMRCAMQADGSAKTARSRSIPVASNNCTPGTRT